jgi:hypothetical protein
LEDKNYLVEAFGNSIGKDIAELTGEATEFALDSCVGEDGLLKDIPFVGTAIKLCTITSKVHKKHSIYKLKAFIESINAVNGDPEELERRKQKFISKAGFRKQELEYLLILIERYIGFDKPKMLGKLYVAYLDGIIIWEELVMYAEVIDRFLLLDCKFLILESETFKTYRNIGVEPILRLVALGLMVEESSNSLWTDDGRGGFAVTTASMERAKSKEKRYKKTEFGEKLATILR